MPLYENGLSVWQTCAAADLPWSQGLSKGLWGVKGEEGKVLSYSAIPVSPPTWEAWVTKHWGLRIQIFTYKRGA